jgi:hypothetical protein
MKAYSDETPSESTGSVWAFRSLAAHRKSQCRPGGRIETLWPGGRTRRDLCRLRENSPVACPPTADDNATNRAVTMKSCRLFRLADHKAPAAARRTWPTGARTGGRLGTVEKEAETAQWPGCAGLTADP